MAVKKTSNKDYYLKYSPVKILLDKAVIIKYNTHYANSHPCDPIQSRSHPRIGHIGYVYMILDKDYVMVLFSDGSKSRIPVLQAFFLRNIERITAERRSCEKDVIAAHGIYEFNKLCRICDAALQGRERDALELAYSSAYSYHFITYAGCPKDYPPYITDQEKWFEEYLLQTKKRKFMEKQLRTNMLREIHAFLINLPILFREKVCEECNYSIPTFYRKMKALKDTPMGIIPALSNAEREEILRQAEYLVDGLRDFLNNFRRPKK